MRRLIHVDRGDQGVVTLVVVGLVAGLLVAMACAVDLGRYVVASWSAQNSADATVLAVATDCARTGSPITDYSRYYKDSQSINTPVCGSGETTITVTKPVSDGLLLNLSKRTEPGLQRTATAKWGTLTGSTGTFPISVAYCAVQNLMYGQKVTLHSYDTPACTTGQGQFGWIQDGCDSSQHVTVGDTLPGTTGNNAVGTGCGAGPDYSGPGGGKDLCVDGSSPPKCFLGTEVLVPVWDTATHTFPGDYPIIGYAVFLLTGWSDNGNNSGGSLKKQCDASADGGDDEHVNKPCIRGTFIRFVTQNGTTGPGPNFGAQVVYLSS
jgi:Putative Flp pilus-assembly TadE/G-like